MRTLLTLILAILGTVASGQGVTFSWALNAATTDPGTNTTGYNLHVGTASGVYTQTINAGLVTTLTVSSLLSGTNYFAVLKAYNAAGVESPASNEVAFTAPLPPTPTPSPVPTPATPQNLHIVP